MSLFDEKEKIRLFETHEKTEKSIKDYAKFLLPIALLVVVGIGVAIYFSLPSIGDQVKPPADLEASVYDYMLVKEKRTASEMVFYKCDGYFWVKVLAEPRSYPPSNLEDAVNQYRLKATVAGENASQVQTLPLPSKEDDIPCK